MVGCDGPSDAGPSFASSPTQTGSGPVTSGAADEVPADARAAHLSELAALDSDLAENVDRAIRRAENICE
jgi:hypothetical protein